MARRQGDCYVLVKDLKRLNDNERAVAVVNLSDEEQTMTIDCRLLDLGGQVNLKGLHDSGKKFFTLHSSLFTCTLPAHATRVFIAKGRRLQRIRYEAETAFLNGYQELKNNQAAMTAICEQDSLCSGGVKVSWLGGRAANDLVWRDVYVRRSGRYALRIVAQTEAMRTLHVDVNGQPVGSLTYTESGQQEVWAELKKGRNIVRLHNDYGRMPDVDYMSVGSATK